MVVLGLIFVVLGLFGVARALTLSIGAVLILFGVIFDVLHFVGHTIALIF